MPITILKKVDAVFERITGRNVVELFPTPEQSSDFYEASLMDMAAHLSKSGLTITPNCLPDSPEMICEDIRGAEEDIRCWQESKTKALELLATLPALILADEADIALTEGKLRQLRAKLARVDRRSATEEIIFPDRRYVGDFLPEVDRG